MNFECLLKLVGDEPVFETALLLAGGVDPAQVRLQLTRWKTSGRIYQFRRGLYALAPPFQKVKPHPFLIANRMVRASYVSCQSALAHYDLIPEYVPVTTSITTARPACWKTPLGAFKYHHVQSGFLVGFHKLRVTDQQEAFAASPEKALLDLVYLTPGSDTLDYLQELRLQNLEELDLSNLQRLAVMLKSPKLIRAAEHIVSLAKQEHEVYETLS